MGYNATHEDFVGDFGADRAVIERLQRISFGGTTTDRVAGNPAAAGHTNLDRHGHSHAETDRHTHACADLYGSEKKRFVMLLSDRF